MEQEKRRFQEIAPYIREYIENSPHIIIKLGTNLLTPLIKDQKNRFLKDLVQEIKKIKSRQKNILIVSSGAVGFGEISLKKNQWGAKIKRYKNEMDLIQRQALASLGQNSLMDMYRKYFGQVHLPTAQILVSTVDFKIEKHYKNLKNTIDQLLSWGVVPIINENDAVATEELSLGDNDTLAAYVAGMYPHSFLLILTTVDGFHIEEKKRLCVEEITPLEKKHAGSPLPGGIGGMQTKLKAAERIIRSGQLMNISDGNSPGVLENAVNAKETGTWFFQHHTNASLGGKKRWLLHNPYSAGSIEIDDGAEKAISARGSLLGVGVLAVEGDFSKNDVVLVKNKRSKVLAKGLVSIDSGSLQKKKQQKGVEVIHRDNLLILKKR